MPPRLDDLLAHIAQLEREVEGELAHAREKWRYRVDAGRVRFERDVRQAHARLRQSIPRFIRESEPRNLITAPAIYSLIVPIALLDLWITIYQAICFRIYGIELVRRSRFIALDRHHLGYLNVIERLNCDYCGYANGVFAYVREVAARTEQVPGARSGTPGTFAVLIFCIAISSIMATLPDTSAGCRCFGRT